MRTLLPLRVKAEWDVGEFEARSELTCPLPTLFVEGAHDEQFFVKSE